MTGEPQTTETHAAGPAQLVELAVTDLGIIEDIRLVFGAGMTALTGETGAGKTLVVGAIDLLLGGRADPTLVRAGADEARVSGRFLVGDDELILTRVVPTDGRSRAYLDGAPVTATALGQRAGSLIDLHGQHAHQSLLGASVQRRALDLFAGTDLTELATARERVAALVGSLDELGGDPGARAREADLLRFQLAELQAAAIEDPDEDASLDAAEDLLAGAVAHREAAATALAALRDDGAASDGVGRALQALEDRAPFTEATNRLRSISAELAEIVSDIRGIGEEIADDPQRLDQVRQRRQLLVELRRKYGAAPRRDQTGQGLLSDVIAYQADAQDRLEALDRHDATAAELDAELAMARRDEQAAAAEVAATRRQAALPLAAEVEAQLHQLAMPAARFEVRVGTTDPGDEVVFALAANPGAQAGPLAKVASGGELARAMLAIRLVLSSAPPLLVFDEVDAGIGGETALAVGRALAELGAEHQVLVVTHLAQVAAFADAQVTVTKSVVAGTTVASAAQLDGPGRAFEVSRMLAGTPESERVQGAADELLARAAQERGR